MSRRIRWNRAALAVVMGGTLAAGCGAPGGDAPQPEATSASLSAAPTCGTAPVTLNAYIETGFPCRRSSAPSSPSSIRT